METPAALGRPFGMQTDLARRALRVAGAVVYKSCAEAKATGAGRVLDPEPIDRAEALHPVPHRPMTNPRHLEMLRAQQPTALIQHGHRHRLAMRIRASDVARHDLRCDCPPRRAI